MATANLLQTSVSGGTQNALSLQGDGVFFPKASTASRLALTLTTTDKGFVVYDTTDSNIYFWNGTAWESIPGSGDAGANGSVQYNDNGTVSGATNFVYTKATGRVGIGTASPQDGFEVVGNSFFRGAAAGVRVGDGGGYGYVSAYDQTLSTPKDLVLQTGGGNVGVGIVPSAWATTTTIWRALDMQYSCGIASTGAGSGEIDFLWNAYYDQTDQRWEFKYTGDRASRYSIGGAGVHTWYNTASTGTANNPITWNPRMTLDASGNLYVAKTSSSSATTGCELQTGAGGNAASVFTATAATVSIMNRLTSDGTIIDFRRETLSVGNIAVTTLATTYNSISDYRLKEDVQPLVGGLARVSALKPSIYKWKANGSAGEGFLAHELASVVSAAVTGEKDAVNEDGSINAQSIDMSRIVPILVAAIQELTARVKTLESR